MNDIVPYQEELNPYLDLVTWQHQKPKYLATIAASVSAPTALQSLLGSIPHLFDIDYAVGVQLDVLGQWIGISRFIDILIENAYFSWDDDPGWDSGLWVQEYEETTGLARLDDEHYRFILKAKIVANVWDGTIPGAYEAWDTLFNEYDYQIVIQNGMAAAATVLTWDGEPLQSWDKSSWERYLQQRTNYIRNSAATGVAVGDLFLPTYWSYYSNWTLQIVETLVIDYVNVLHIQFFGSTATDATYLYFETSDQVPVIPDDGVDWTFSVYFRQYFSIEPITGLFVDLVFCDNNNAELLVLSEEIFAQSNDELIRYQITCLFADRPERTAVIRPRLRFDHPGGAILPTIPPAMTSYEIVVGAPQLEMESVATKWIPTSGEALVAWDHTDTIARVNGGMHMIYGLIAPYQDPPGGPDYFTWDNYDYFSWDLGHNAVEWELAYSSPGVLLSGTQAQATLSKVNQTTFCNIGVDFKYYFELGIIGGEMPDYAGILEYFTLDGTDSQGLDDGFWDGTIIGAKPVSVGVGDTSVLILPGNSTNPEGWWLGQGASLAWAGKDGSVWLDGVQVATWETYGTGNTVCLAVDPTNNRMWGRVSADPATNLGGVDISSLVGQLFPGLTLWDDTFQITGHFVANEWLYTAPVGFASLQVDFVEVDQGWDYGLWDISPVGTDTLGWNSGVWDVTATPVTAPQYDAVTMSLFAGGYLDLRPAGVTMEYCVQSLVGTPFFAWDTNEEVTYNIDYFSWDETDLEGWDIGSWDTTQLSYISLNLRAPPTYVAGWENGAWPNFIDSSRYAPLPLPHQRASHTLPAFMTSANVEDNRGL
jgi:hypothetical protein